MTITIVLVPYQTGAVVMMVEVAVLEAVLGFLGSYCDVVVVVEEEDAKDPATRDF